MLNTLLIDPALLAARRNALLSHNDLIGIDYVKLNRLDDTNRWYLSIYFLDKPNPIPLTIQPANISLIDSSQNSLSQLYVNQIYYPSSPAITTDIALTIGYDGQALPNNLLVVELIQNNQVTQLEGGIYHLRLSNVNGLDPFFSQVSFSPFVNQSADFDYVVTKGVKPATTLELPEINYLARDYLTFRQLLLDRLTVLLPDWELGHIADMPTAVIEMLAHVADQVSYYQDAVATEAYLNTARQRISVKRHAKLLGYTIHEGCNARVWVHIQVKAQLELPAKTPILSQIPDQDVCIANTVYQQLPTTDVEVFASFYPVTLYPEQNAISIYNWGISEFSLAKGATSATLQGKITSLVPGDVLLLEQVKGSDEVQYLDPKRRHLVRLTAVNPTQKDQLGGLLQTPPSSEVVELTEISWHTQDALPFTLAVSSVINGQLTKNLGLARGNLVLADHGLSVQDPELMLDKVQGSYSLKLSRSAISYAAPFDADMARLQPAVLACQQNPQQAQPVLKLYQNEQAWQVRPDLLDSDSTSQDFVVEVDNKQQVFVRFGDNRAGKQPETGVPLRAEYRVGNGEAGNIGAAALVHVVVNQAPETLTDYPIISIYNPLPAQGGTEPEIIDQVKLYLPHTLGQMQRAVTLEDYVYFAEQHAEVAKAAAVLRWTGSRSIIVLAIDRKGDLPVDAEFQQHMLDYFASFMLFGHELKIVAPNWVPLDIALAVYVKQDYSLNAVRRTLLERFSNRDLADGKRGFFHPDNFSFADNVYLSQIITEALTVPGVASIDLHSSLNRFKRRYSANNDTYADGMINIGKLEIAQLTNDINIPSQGQIEFFMEYSYA